MSTRHVNGLGKLISTRKFAHEWSYKNWNRYLPRNGIIACAQDFGKTKVDNSSHRRIRNDSSAVTIRGRGNLKEMADLSKIVGQLKKERDRVQQQLSGLNAALAAFAGVYGGGSGKSLPGAPKKRRTMSAKGPCGNPAGAKSPMGEGQGSQQEVVFIAMRVVQVGPAIP